MTAGTYVALLVGSYVFIAVCVLLTLVYARIDWRLKSTIITMSLAFFVWSYFGLSQIMGWPSDRKLPEKFGLVSSLVVEPRQGDGGSIYIWARLRDGDGNQIREPHAFKLPYSREMHKALTQGDRMAQQAQKQGMGKIGVSANRVTHRRGNTEEDSLKFSYEMIEPPSKD